MTSESLTIFCFCQHLVTAIQPMKFLLPRQTAWEDSAGVTQFVNICNMEQMKEYSNQEGNHRPDLQRLDGCRTQHSIFISGS